MENISPFRAWLAERGNTAKLAAALDITHAAVRQWNGHCPAERVVEVEAATGIPREDLRPDLFRRAAPPRLGDGMTEQLKSGDVPGHALCGTGGGATQAR